MNKFLIILLLSGILYNCTPTKKVSSIETSLIDLLDSKLFLDTTEGIESSELNLLKSTGESENWNLSDYKDYLHIKSNVPGSEIYVLQLSRDKLFVNTLNGQNISSKTYLIKGDQIISYNLIPTIQAKDFFEDTNFLIGADKNHLVYTYFDENSRQIKAGINTWMDPLFEETEPDYSITLVWKNDKFEILKENL